MVAIAFYFLVDHVGRYVARLSRKSLPVIDLALKRLEFSLKNKIDYIEKGGIPDKAHANLLLTVLFLTLFSHASYERNKPLPQGLGVVDRGLGVLS